MRLLAFVCPGQGSQAVGMGQALAADSPAAAAVFAAADRALGMPISELAWNGPAERLDLTENAQPAILAASMAILAALRERWAAAELTAPVPRTVVPSLNVTVPVGGGPLVPTVALSDTEPPRATVGDAWVVSVGVALDTMTSSLASLQAPLTALLLAFPL